MLATIVAAVATLTGAMTQTPQDITKTPSLTVNGSAQIKAQPDVAYVRIGAVAQAATAQAAQAEVNKKIQAFLKSGRALLGSKGTIETGSLSLMPVYSQQNPRPGEEFTPQITAYRAYNTLNAEVTDFALVGPLIDAAVKEGLNNIESVSFGLRDDTTARLDALKQAVKQAKQKAEAMAEAAGVEIVGIADISEQGARVMPYMARNVEMLAARAGEAPTPVEPGSVSISADVVLRYTIRGK